MLIKIINGPNLNMVGQREPGIYGSQSLEEYFEIMTEKHFDVEFLIIQSNYEGKIVDEIQSAKNEQVDGIILNAGAYTHYSIAIRDAILAVKVPTIEVHISNVFSREDFRKKSVISDICVGVISGFGLYSYDLALAYFLNQCLNNAKK